MVNTCENCTLWRFCIHGETLFFLYGLRLVCFFYMVFPFICRLLFGALLNLNLDLGNFSLYGLFDMFFLMWIDYYFKLHLPFGIR